MTAARQHRSLAEHIGRAQLMVYGAAVVLATVGASIVGYHYLHQQMAAHLQNLARITAIESQAGLVFGDDSASAEVLRAIPLEEGVTRAELRDADGKLRASIDNAPSGLIGALASHLAGEQASAPVIADRRTIGEVRLQGGEEPLLNAFLGLILADIVVVTCIGILSLFVSRRNTRRITRPLTQLRTLMHAATQQRDFTQRAPAADIAEVDDLRVQFNGLLDEIVQRDQVLRASNQVLQRLAFHDPLTGLPNRAMLERALATTLDECRENGTKAALFYLDADSFKSINDTFGHDVGDQLLVTIADRLRVWMPERATPARLGGDEFVVLIAPLSEAGEHNESTTVRLVHALRATLEQPLRTRSCIIHPGVSIGVAVYPDDAGSAEALLQSADKSMYQMKGLHYRAAAVTRWSDLGDASAIAPRPASH
ncbi:MAG: diguanylate cyclase [Proteobacteria bacterium]|nr:diguanylate cyclase [Pseudomonadota bacterium]